MNLQTTVTLNNGVKIPQIGLGVFRAADGDETRNAVKWALEAGFRHIDTAAIYGNEESVGEAIRQSGVPREELFVTTKLWNQNMRDGRELEGFEESLRKLGLEYVDLYLIHWPVEVYPKAWAFMEKIYKEGRTRAIGVSNFQTHHLETLSKTAAVTPAVNQIELSPILSQYPLCQYCEKLGIKIEAWGPLGAGACLSDPVIKGIGDKYGKSPAQVIIRWDLQRGLITFPKSINKDRIFSNTQVYDFSLTPEDMAAIDALNKDQRLGADPDTFDF